MKRIFLVFFIVFLLIVNQSPAWCTEKAITFKLSNYQQIYTIEKNTFQENLKPWQLADNLENNNEFSLLWLASIIIPGLGQALLGSVLRGITFTGAITGLIILWGISRAVNLSFFLGTIVSGQPSANLFDFVGTFIIFSIAIIHIWNILDAYSLSKEPPEPEEDQDTEITYLQKLESEALSYVYQQRYLTINF